MSRQTASESVVAELQLEECPPGPVLQTMEEPTEVDRSVFADWETPLAPWGCFNRDSCLRVVRDGDRSVLEIDMPQGDWGRALVTRVSDVRDCRVTADVTPVDAAAWPNADRSDCREALVGIVFRVRTSRCYYQFGIEGKRRVVLYRRADEEWSVLAQRDVPRVDESVTLEVALDGDGIRCTCGQLGVELFCTDTTIREGRAGVRAIGKARVSCLRITQTPSQAGRDECRRRGRRGRLKRLGAGIPDAVPVRTIDVGVLGGTPVFSDFCNAARIDMLVPGERLRAATVDGDVLWECPVLARQVVFSADRGSGARLIFAFTGRRAVETRLNVSGTTSDWAVADEICVIDGKTGELVARTRLPTQEEPVRFTDFSQTTARLSGSERTDIILREWRRDAGDGGFNLWAYDRDLNLLWRNRVRVPYGHNSAVQFSDVDGDGRDEVLAGGTLFSADGHMIWEHDLADEMLRINGAGHYDSVALGAFADDPEVDPVAFLFGGSAGVYVVDGLTGRTRMVHRIGHAQTHIRAGALRPGLPGTQIVAFCRWGNFGITTLLSGAGDRLWTRQPSSIPGVSAVRWADRDVLWVNGTGAGQAFYDGYGRKIKELRALRELWGDRMRRDVRAAVVRLGRDPTDLLAVTIDGTMHLFGPG